VQHCGCIESRGARNVDRQVLPFTLHSAGDYLAAALLVLAPLALNFNNGDGGLSVFSVVAVIAVLAVSLVTNYQYSPVTLAFRGRMVQAARRGALVPAP
jgi:hypothetical protein